MCQVNESVRSSSDCFISVAVFRPTTTQQIKILHVCFLCSREGEYRPSRSFSFVSWYPHGVSSVVYDAAHSALIVGGTAEQTDGSATESAASGLTVWRILSDAPHYKLVSDTDTVAVSWLTLLLVVWIFIYLFHRVSLSYW